MKLPPVVIIKHCPKLNPDRKIFLSQHLEERVPIKDVRWIEDYNHEDTFVWWFNHYLKLPYGMKLTSHTVKTVMAFKMMVDENIESAFIVEDDAVFMKNWQSIFESLPEVDPECLLNIGNSGLYDMKPEHGKIFVIGNNAGCEVMWCSLTFAKHIMNNLNVNQITDIVVHAHVFSIQKPLLCVPLCHQTSGLERASSLEHESRKTENWIDFLKNYEKSPKIDFEQILRDFEPFKERKEKLENKFFELFGKRIDIKDYEYITQTGEIKLDILTFD